MPTCLSYQPKYKFSLPTKENPDSAHPIVIIHLPLSPYRLCRPIYKNSNPSFIISKPNTCLASQITRNMSVMMILLTWVHSRGCSILMKASIVHPVLEFRETLINWSTIWLYNTLKVLELEIRPMYWTPTDNTQLWTDLRRFARATGTDCIGQPYILGGFAPEKICLADVLDIY